MALVAVSPARMRMRHPAQTKKFIFFLLFQHLAETHLMSSDMGHLEPGTVAVAGSRTFATIGECVRFYSRQRNAPNVQHTDERLRAATASTIAGPRWSSISQLLLRLIVPIFCPCVWRYFDEAQCIAIGTGIGGNGRRSGRSRIAGERLRSRQLRQQRR